MLLLHMGFHFILSRVSFITYGTLIWMSGFVYPHMSLFVCKQKHITIKIVWTLIDILNDLPLGFLSNKIFYDKYCMGTTFQFLYRAPLNAFLNVDFVEIFFRIRNSYIFSHRYVWSYGWLNCRFACNTFKN